MTGNHAATLRGFLLAPTRWAATTCSYHVDVVLRACVSFLKNARKTCLARQRLLHERPREFVLTKQCLAKRFHPFFPGTRFQMLMVADQNLDRTNKRPFTKG